jgi:hypothetical protein
VCSQDRQPKSRPLQLHWCGPVTLWLLRALRGDRFDSPFGEPREGDVEPLSVVEDGNLKFYPKITGLLWALLPRVDGNPAIQSLVMCLYFIASGVATSQLKMLYALAFNIIVTRGPRYLPLRRATGRDSSHAPSFRLSRYPT